MIDAFYEENMSPIIQVRCEPRYDYATTIVAKSTSGIELGIFNLRIWHILNPKFRCCWKAVKKEKKSGKGGKRRRNWGCVVFSPATSPPISPLSVNSVVVSIATTTEMARRAGAD